MLDPYRTLMNTIFYFLTVISVLTLAAAAVIMPSQGNTEQPS
jgi:hypothetical protein